MASEAATEPSLGSEAKDQHPPVAGHGASSLPALAPSVDVRVEDPARHDGDAAETKSSPIESDSVRRAGMSQFPSHCERMLMSG